MPQSKSPLNEIYPEYDTLTKGQKKILEAALELFSEKGFASTSTKAIAKKAAVSEALIFKHFWNKKQLFFKLVQPIALKVFFPITLRPLQEVLSKDYEKLEDLLDALLRERMDFMLKHKRIVRIVIQEIGLNKEIQNDLKANLEASVEIDLKKQFEKFRDLGAIRQMEFQTFFRLMMSCFMGLILIQIMFDSQVNFNLENEIDQTIKTLTQGLKP